MWEKTGDSEAKSCSSVKDNRHSSFCTTEEIGINQTCLSCTEWHVQCPGMITTCHVSSLRRSLLWRWVTFWNVSIWASRLAATKPAILFHSLPLWHSNFKMIWKNFLAKFSFSSTRHMLGCIKFQRSVSIAITITLNTVEKMELFDLRSWFYSFNSTVKDLLTFYYLTNTNHNMTPTRKKHYFDDFFFSQSHFKEVVNIV